MSSFYGLDIIRAYEVSWLNSLGKPEIALLEIFQDGVKPDIDTWKLKTFLGSITNKAFSEFKSIRSEIYNYLHTDPNFGDSYVKLTAQQDFYSIDFTKPIAPTEFPHKFSHGLRFICEKTEQPFIGTASIYTARSNTNVRDQLVHVLVELRNLKFTPRNFAFELFNKHFNQSINDDFVLTINLNRRGGTSFQSIRCRRSIDFAEYIHREVLE